MIIYGWGRRTNKVAGQSKDLVCPTCNHLVKFNLVEAKRWFTLFFIPIFPYENKKLAVCPNCNNGRFLTKEQFGQAVTTGNIPGYEEAHNQALSSQGL